MPPVLLSTLLATAQAADLQVDPADPAAFATIQQALDAALDGDRVVVAAGTYRECLVANADITLDAADVVLDASGCVEPALEVDGHALTVSGLAIEDAPMGGIHAVDADLTLLDVQVAGCEAENGAGLLLERGTLLVERGWFHDNVATSGGGIYALDALDVTLLDTVVEANRAWTGGGALLTTVTGTISGGSFLANLCGAEHGYNYGCGASLTGDLRIEGVTFQDNRPADDYAGYPVTGAAIAWWGGPFGRLDIVAGADGTPTTFEHNDAGPSGLGGALYSFYAPTVLNGVRFEDNAAWRGGAIYLVNSTMSLQDADLVGNRAVDDGGFYPANGGAVAGDGSELDISASTLEGNAADGIGGALYLEDSRLTVQGATFRDNAAGLVEAEIDQGGGALATLDTTVDLADSAFEENESVGCGGAIAIQDTVFAMRGTTLDQNQATGTWSEGGALCALGADVDIQDSTFSDNQAYDYGAVWLYEGQASLHGTTFQRNLAEQWGGALGAFSTTLEIRDCRFEANEARYTSAIRADGRSITIGQTEIAQNIADDYEAVEIFSFFGEATEVVLEDLQVWDNRSGAATIYVQDATSLQVLGGRFERNISEYLGGALWVYDTPTEVVGTEFVNNIAAIKGGAIYLSGQSVEVRESVFLNNSADRGGAICYQDDGSDGYLVLNNNVFGCNEAYYGGAIYVDGADLLSRNNLYVENQAVDDGAAIELALLTFVDAAYDTYVGNRTGDGYGVVSAYDAEDTAWGQVAYSVFAENTTAAVDAELLGSQPALKAPHNLLWDNDVGSEDEADNDTAIRGDPVLQGISLDGDCTNDDPLLGTGSAAARAGDPDDVNCDGSSPTDLGATGGPDSLWCDADGDGTIGLDDCDDQDPLVQPGAEESCNGLDDDCDGEVDEPPVVDGATWTLDADGDGWGDDATATTACTVADLGDPPAGARWVGAGGDCDDGDADVHPGAVDTPGDGIDQDCDGADAPGEVPAGDETDAAGCGCAGLPGPAPTPLPPILWAAAAAALGRRPARRRPARATRREERA